MTHELPIRVKLKQTCERKIGSEMTHHIPTTDILYTKATGRPRNTCIMTSWHEDTFHINSLAPHWEILKKFYLSKLKLIFVIDGWGISGKVALR